MSDLLHRIRWANLARAAAVLLALALVFAWPHLRSAEPALPPAAAAPLDTTPATPRTTTLAAAPVVPKVVPRARKRRPKVVRRRRHDRAKAHRHRRGAGAPTRVVAVPAPPPAVTAPPPPRPEPVGAEFRP